ncbi:polysaccharide biosynthesis tyrosine autokinase [Microbacterium koreense]|uniref:Polysaccharide biosynthesis tyrosine autokinase n=1 Tax=Microbacterium koreense TaxID=323761 RepID=A0ABW2ZQ75_9MICO
MTSSASVWTLGTVWAALRKHWLVIAGTVLVGALMGFVVASATTPTYQARATLFVSINQGSSGSDLNQGTAYAQNQMQSFARLATSSRVLEPVIDDLDLDITARELARNIAVINPHDTVILTIEVTSTSPERAAAVANAVSESLAAAVREVSPTTAEDAPTITASVIDDAVVPLYQSAPSKPRDTVLGAAVGLIVGVAFALLRSLLDTRMPTVESLRETVPAPVLGVISRVRRGRERLGLVVAQDPLGSASEEFRRVRSALTYAGVSSPTRRLLVTSTSQGEGKTTFAANFALTLAALRSRVLLVDADLRRPRVAEIFGVEQSIGLTTVLLGDADFEDAKLSRMGTGVDILTAGIIPPNPAGMLTSDAMHEFLDHVTPLYDYVIIDSPPISSVADANLLSPVVDGALIVVDATRTRRSALAAAVASFDAAGGRIVGMVLNKVRTHRRTDGYYTETGKAASAVGADK